MRHERRWAKAFALLGTLGAIAVLPATAVATGSNTGPHSSDIEVSKTAVKAETVGAMTTISWKVVVSNDGGRDLESVTLTDPGVIFDPPVSTFDDHCATKPEKDDKSSNEHNNVSPCVDDPALLQEHETLTYIGTQTMAKACGWVTNTVKVTAEDMISGRVYGKQKPTLEASATAKIFLACPDFEVIKTAKSSSYNEGDTIEWIVTVTNTGNVPLSNPVLTDPGVTFGPPSSTMSIGSAKQAKSVAMKPSTNCEKKSSSKSPKRVKDDCKDDDDPKCEDDDKGHSAKSVSKNDDCVKDDGVLRPGEVLTYVGTQSANTCGVVTNTVTVTVTSRPLKMHDRDEAKDGDAKYASSKTKAGGKKVVVKRSKKDKKYPPHKGDKPKDKPHAPPMPAVELTKTSAPATTFVLCDVVVTKTANVEFTRTFDWTITKSVSPVGPIEPPAGATGTTLNYTVTATKLAGADSNFKVVGAITVKNPYSSPLPVTVSDQLSTGSVCTVTTPSFTIPATTTATLGYVCDVGATRPAAGTTNTATAGFTVGGTMRTATGVATVPAGTVPTTVVNDSVTVTDAFADVSPPTTLFTTSATLVHPYSVAVGLPTSGCVPYVNVATLMLAGATKTAQATVQVCAPAPTVAGVATPVGNPVQPPSLRVTKTGPATATAGRLATYRITVTNSGAGEARDVMLRDVLPRGFSVPGKVAGGSVSKGAVSWDLGTLAAGASQTVKVTFRIDRGVTGRRCNTAIATPSNGANATGTRCTRIVRVAGVARSPGVTG